MSADLRPGLRASSSAAVGGIALVASLLLVGCVAPGASSPVASEASTTPSHSASAEQLHGELRVLAAASLSDAFEALTSEFSRLHPGVTFAPTVYDGSSTLAAQLIAGAPADIFAAADEHTMQSVVEEDLVTDEPEIFTSNEMVIAVAPGNPLGVTSLGDLVDTQRGAQPVVVTCAAEVPCGRAGHALLERAGVALTPASEEQNVSAVLTKVRTGEADAGIVYRSDIAGSSGEVSGVEISGSELERNSYPIAVLKDANAPDAAAAFSAFVRSSDGQRILTELGFTSP